MEELKYHYKYPHPAVTTDCVIFGYDGERLKVLLIERSREPYKGKWAFPGGFLNIDESAEDGALRELQEETGLTHVKIRQFHAFSSPGRDPRERVISIAYFALVRLDEVRVRGGDDAARADWFRVDDMPPLAFDHEEMFCLATESLRRCAGVEPIGGEVLPDKFTLSEFTSLYSAIFGTDVTGKMLDCGLIAPVGNPGKPLYEFRMT